MPGYIIIYTRAQRKEKGERAAARIVAIPFSSDTTLPTSVTVCALKDDSMPPFTRGHSPIRVWGAAI